MDISTKTAEEQIYENIKVIPIVGDKNNNKDLLDLKTGFVMGLVEIKECVPETVNSLIVVNNAVTPLIIFDGEQIEGAKQNRIMNQTVIIPPKTEMKVPVSCSEQGRWSYKSEFKHSNHFADWGTRQHKRRAIHNKRSSQDAVWREINRKIVKCGIQSPTSAMLDTYNATKEDAEEYLNNLNLVDNQIGVVVFINNEFKGIEVLNNPEIYANYHNMILNSYVLEAITNRDEQKKSDDNLEDVLNQVSNMDLKDADAVGIEKVYEATSDNILGTIANYEDDLIHAVYFKKGEEDYTGIRKPAHIHEIRGNWVR